MIVGEAQVLIVPSTAGFAAALDAESQGAFGKFKDDAGKAGKNAGGDLRAGVKSEAGRLDGDMAEAGLAAGGGLRRGVREETGKLGGDLEKAGKAGGDGLTKGMSGGLAKLANLVSNTGLPLGGLSSGLEKAGSAAEKADHSSGGLWNTLDKVGGVALVGVAAGFAGAAAEGIHLAEGMQTADAAIASAAGISTKAAKEIGDSFLNTAGKSTFSGEEMAKAFASVAGQLKATEGRALTAAQATKVMSSASDLAEAKQISLGSATETLAKVMQTFGLHANESAHASDVLYSASTATGVSVEQLGSQLSKVRGKLGETAGSVGQLSSLLVDMTEHGITGRGAMSALSSGMNTLLKTSEGVTVAQGQQNTAYAAMSPQLKALAKEYESGAISSTEFKKQTELLAPAQTNLVGSFTKAQGAVQTAQLKYKEMGLTVFDAQGKFVGMGAIIDQLGPRFQKMTKEQQLAAATTLFGTGAARQMVAVIQAGPQAYDKATQSVEKHRTAEEAARKQSETLHGEIKTLSATFVDLGTKLGEILIPVVTKMVKSFTEATTFILHHKEVLIALAALVAGPLTVAISVFTINKMAAFQKSFVEAGARLGLFAAQAKTTAGEVEVAGEAEVASADATAGGIDAALGATGVGLVLVGLGVAATEIGTHWKAVMKGLEEAAQAVVGGIEKAFEAVVNTAINALNSIIRHYNETIGEITGSIGELEKYGNAAVSKAAPSGAAVNQATGAGGSASGGSKVENEILNFWLSKGFSGNAAAGFVGNAAQESSLNPNSPGGGLYQQSGYPASYGQGSVASQSEHVLASLSPSLRAALNRAKSPAEAAHLIEMDYEKPKGSQPGESATTNNRPHRERAAEEAAAHIKGTHATEHNTAALESNTAAHGGKAAGGKAASPEREAEKATKAQEKAAHEHERQTAQQVKAEEAAKKKALADEVKGQEGALTKWVSGMLAEEAKAGPALKGALNQEVAEHKAYIATMIKEEKAGLTQQAAAKKAQAALEVRDQEQGEKEKSKLQTLVTEGSLKSLNTSLTKVNEGALQELENRLDATHKSALSKLAGSLASIWKEGLAKKASAEAAERVKAAEEAAAAARAAQEAAAKQQEDAERAQAAAISKDITFKQDQANAAITHIQDQSKVEADQAAEAGLSGGALTTAKLQTSLDQMHEYNDAVIAEAKLRVDEIAGTGPVLEARAQQQLAELEGRLHRKEAEATAQLEASKAVTEKEKAAGTTAPGPGYTFNLYAGGMSAGEAIGEIGWAFKTGALPPPPAVPVPA